VHGPSGNRVAVAEARRLLRRYKKQREAIDSDWASAKKFGGMQSVGRMLAFGRDSLSDPVHAYECAWCRRLI
jgi:hypothetical protein